MLIRGKSFDVKDCETNHSTIIASNYVEPRPTAKNSCPEKELKNPQKKSEDTQDLPLTHNHIHLHYHNHIHSNEQNESESVDNKNILKIKGNIDMYPYVDEKIKILTNIINSNTKEYMEDKTHNVFTSRKKDLYDDSDERKGNGKSERKSFSLLNLLCVSTQINPVLLTNKEFDVCRIYYNNVKNFTNE